MKTFLHLLRYELTLAWHNGRNSIQAWAFFAFVPVMFHFALGDALDSASAPGIVWTSLLLAHLLAVDGLFRDDLRDGMLDQLILSPGGLLPAVSAKYVAVWLTVSLPMIVLTPFVTLSMNAVPTWEWVSILVPGTIGLTSVAACGAAMTAHYARRGGLLLVICLPLTVPLLIFALGAMQDDHAESGFRLLCGYGLCLLPLSLAVSVVVLRTEE